MKSAPKKVRERKVRGWGILNDNGTLEMAHTNKIITEHNAKVISLKYPDIKTTVVPCTISFKVPKIIRTKKKSHA